MRWTCHALLSSLLTVLAVGGAGCPQPRSENNTLELQGHGVHVPPRPGAFAFTAEQPILVGSRVCGSLHCTAECPSVGDGGSITLFPEVGECYTSSAEGTASVDDGGCLVFEGEGAVAYRHEPAACDLERDGGWAPTEDSFHFVATTLDGLEARFEHALEAYGAVTLESDEPEYVPTADFPEDFLPAPDDVLQLLAGEEVRIPVSLVEASSGTPVGYRPTQATFEITETSPAQDGGAAAEIEIVPGGFPFVTMAAGGELEVAMRIDDAAGNSTRLVVGTVRGVAADVITSLEVHSFRPEPADQATVLGLRAIARDSSGAHVYGVPVAWELGRGRFVVDDLSRYGGRRRPLETEEIANDPLPGSARADWIYLTDDCRDPAFRLGEREANVTATFGELAAEHAITWEQVGPQPNGGEFEPSARCEGIAIDPGGPDPEPTPDPDAIGDPSDCACDSAAGSTGAGPEAAILGVMVVGAAFWRRRRRR